MDPGEYKRLYYGLNRPEDIDRFREEGYDRRLLETLYNQKVNRNVKKKYHLVKKNAPKMLRMWKKGKSICDIADEFGFPPILTAMLIFQEDGTGKKIFWEYVRDPSLLDSEVTADELREASARDLVYSLEGNEKSKERGKWGEGLLWEWLDSQGVDYMTEEDERREDGSQGSKTPDCLLAEPMNFCGKKIFWIESKASFGDAAEFKINSNKQLIPYTELFGPGVVVYWTGYLDGLACPEGVTLEDIGILEKKLTKWKDE